MAQPFPTKHQTLRGTLPLGGGVYRDCLALNETIEVVAASEGDS